MQRQEMGKVFQRAESRSYNQKGSQAESQNSTGEQRKVGIVDKDPTPVLQRAPFEVLKHQPQ